MAEKVGNMPQMANIVAGGVTFVALTPSSGDTTPARWRVENAPSAIGMPKASIATRYNGQKTARRVDISYEQPYYVLAPATNQLTLLHKVPLTVTAVLPDGVPTIYLEEAVDRFIAFISSDIGRQTLKGGYAPT